MGWAEKTFADFRLYAVTDLKAEDAEILRQIEQAYRGGVDIVQLRSKVLSDAALLRLGLKIRALASLQRKLFFFNDRLDLALAAGAHGVHLGQDDMPVKMARRIAAKAGVTLWIGKSTHSLKQALEAQREGADYIGVGPVFATPTKPGKCSVGLSFVQQAAAHIQIPWVAIGGIDLCNIRSVIDSGAKRIAVVRAIFAVKRTAAAARELKQQMEGNTYGENA